MADKSIEQLNAAEKVYLSDLFVLQQSGTAKKLTGQVLKNWLLELAQGHGGITSIKLQSTSGLTKTYRITLADDTYFDLPISDGNGIKSISNIGTAGFVKTYRIAMTNGTNFDFSVTDGNGVKNFSKVSTSGLTKTYRFDMADGTHYGFAVEDGKGITSVAKTGTEGLVDTYTMKFNAGADFVFSVRNGAKGDKGDADRLYFKFASQKPTDASHSMGDVPDAWLGFYAGTTAPTSWKDYTWVRIKGDKGDKGDPATLTGRSVTYMVSDSGTIVPSGSWLSEIPNVPQGKYLWTRVVLTFNTGNPVTSYSVARMGLDGTGSVSAVNGKSPDSTGNVKLSAADINAADGQSIDANLEAKADKTATVTVTLTSAGWSGGFQTVGADGVAAEGDVLVCPTPESMAAYLRAGIWCAALQTGAMRFGCRVTPTEAIQVSVKPFGA